MVGRFREQLSQAHTASHVHDLTPAEPDPAESSRTNADPADSDNPLARIEKV
jgi:hypothetical protein